ncbi:MAG: glycosyltransferase family 39 protein [Chloroflexi bacterium]|nr:glycosyltransferase family 39 protein [Chloroflexota bacterium]
MARNKSWFLIIFVAAAWLRLTNLGLKSLWLDEAFAVWNANLSPLEIWQATYDNHPPLYYLLLHGWMAVLGRSEVLVRLPSVFNSMVGLALAYRLGRRLLGRDAAVAATLLALAPLDVWYAQEARMVSFVIPAALLLALGLSCLLDRPWPATLLIAVGLALSLYFDYTIVPLWVGLGGVWLAYWGRNGRPVQPLLAWLAGSLAGWLAFAPLWPHLALVVGRYGGIFFFANLSQALKLPALTAAVFLAAMGLLAVGTATGAWLLWRLLARPLPRNTLVVLAVAGFTLATLLAPVPRLYSLKRLVVTGWPFAVLLVTWLLARAARPGGARYPAAGCVRRGRTRARSEVRAGVWVPQTHAGGEPDGGEAGVPGCVGYGDAHLAAGDRDLRCGCRRKLPACGVLQCGARAMRSEEQLGR